MFKNKTEQNTHNEKYNQTNITVKIHRNHDGVSATAIMLKSIAAGSPWRSPVIAVKQVSEITSEWTSESILWYFIGHTSRFFMALSSRVIFSAVVHSKNTHLEQFAFLVVMWKNLRVFMNHNLAAFHWTFHLQILCESILPKNKICFYHRMVRQIRAECLIKDI